MKRLNILLIIITLICSAFTIIGEFDKGIVVVLKDASIVFTVFLPYIIEKIFKIKLPEGCKTIWIIFIFLAHYLGVTAEYYNKWEGFDKVTHTISGVLTAYVAAVILQYNKSKKLVFNVLFILSFTWLCAGLWEVFEFTCNYLFGGDAQRVAATGVSDTMWDMIVAFFGSIAFNIYYVIRTKLKEK